jgi:hypothetical protein
VGRFVGLWMRVGTSENSVPRTILFLSIGPWSKLRLGPAGAAIDSRRIRDGSSDARLAESVAIFRLHESLRSHMNHGVSTAPRPFGEPVGLLNHATAVTAPSRPASAEAVAGFDPRATLAGYRSPSRGLVLSPPWGFSRRTCRAFAEMTGSPQRGCVENVQHASRERRNRSSRRARRSLAPEAVPRVGATLLVAHKSWLTRAHDLAGQTGLRRATRSARGRRQRRAGGPAPSSFR